MRLLLLLWRRCLDVRNVLLLLSWMIRNLLLYKLRMLRKRLLLLLRLLHDIHRRLPLLRRRRLLRQWLLLMRCRDGVGDGGRLLLLLRSVPCRRRSRDVLLLHLPDGSILRLRLRLPPNNGRKLLLRLLLYKYHLLLLLLWWRRLLLLLLL